MHYSLLVSYNFAPSQQSPLSRGELTQLLAQDLQRAVDRRACIAQLPCIAQLRQYCVLYPARVIHLHAQLLLYCVLYPGPCYTPSRIAQIPLYCVLYPHVIHLHVMPNSPYIVSLPPCCTPPGIAQLPVYCKPQSLFLVLYTFAPHILHTSIYCTICSVYYCPSPPV